MKFTDFLKIGMAGVLSVAMAATVMTSATGCKTDKPGNTDEDFPVTLSVVGDDSYNLSYGESKNIAVRARFNDNSEPAVGRKVSFLINGQQNGATLSATEVVTDDTGVATTTIKAGDLKANFAILVSSGSSNQVQFNIDIDGADIGSLRVYFDTKNSNISFSKLVAKIHPQIFNCANYADWSTMPPAEAELSSSNANLPVKFDGLKEGSKYTVSVTAEGPEGNVIARGCSTGENQIVGRKITDVSVELGLMPTAFTGTYQMATTLHLLSMLPGSNEDNDSNKKVSAAYIVNKIIGFFRNPGNELMTLLKDDVIPPGTWSTVFDFGQTTAVFALDTYFCATHDGVPDGDGSSDFVNLKWEEINPDGSKGTTYSCACFKNLNTKEPCTGNTKKPDSLGIYINLLIGAYAPSWVGSIFEVGNSIAAMVENLAVGGELEISKAIKDENADTYTIEGVERWNSYMFTWLLGKNCTAGDTCCGQTVFGTGNAVNNKLDAASAAFTGKATAIDMAGQIAYQLQIDEHTIALDYGKIISYLLTNLAFPALAKMEGTVSFSDVLIKLIPIANVGCWFNGLIGSFGDATLDDVYNACMATCSVTSTQLTNGQREWNANNCGTFTQYIIEGLKLLGGKGEDWLNQLSTSGTDKYKFTISTNDAKSSQNIISDTNFDLQTDLIGLIDQNNENMGLALKGSIYFGDAEKDAVEMTGSLVGDFARVISTDVTATDRTTCHSDAQCINALGENRSCQIREGLISKCAERMVCALNNGTAVGGAACNFDSDCRSGFCMSDTKKCYAACANDSDCTNASAGVCNSNINYDFADGKYSAKVSGCKAN